jgi:tetratricopeptide (TPR) repeat protein
MMSTALNRKTGTISLWLLVGVASLLFVSGCTRDPHVRAQKYVSKGEQYFAKAQYSAASIEFRNALKADPGSAVAAYRLGVTELTLQNWPDAYSSLKKAVGINPNYVEAQLQLAQLLLAARQVDEARQAIAAALATDPKSVNALLLSSHADLAERRISDAKADLSSANKIAPSDPRILMEIGDIAAFEQRYTEAVAAYRSATASDAKFFQAYAHLAQVLALQHNDGAAADALNQGIEHNPQVVQLYLALAALDTRQGDTAGTEAVFQRLRTTEGNAAAKLYAIGDFYLRFGDVEKGKAALNEALQKDAKYEPARRELIEADISAGDLKAAEALVSQILKQRPKDPEGRLYQARLMAARNDFAKAQEVLESLVHDVPELARAHLALGMTYAAQNDLGRATASIQRAISRDPDLLGAYMALGEVALRQNDTKLAMTSVEEILKRNPRSLQAHLMRGNVLLAANQPQQALAEFEPLASAQPRLAGLQERVGFAYLRTGQLDKAEKSFEQSLQDDPAHVPAMRALGVLYEMQHRNVEKLIARLQQQIQASPQPLYYDMLGMVYMGARKHEAAEAAFQSELQKTPKAATAYVQLARLYVLEGRFPEAIHNAEQATQMQPGFLPAYFLLGEAYDKSGEYHKAEQAYEELLKKAPNTPSALNNLAWLYSEHEGNLDVALDMAQRAKQGMPNDPSVTDTLAWIQYRKGLAAIAANDFSDLVRRSPENPTYSFHLGMALLKLGRESEARTALQRALTLNLPSNLADEARNALAGLKTKAS